MEMQAFIIYYYESETYNFVFSKEVIFQNYIMSKILNISIELRLWMPKTGLRHAENLIFKNISAKNICLNFNLIYLHNSWILHLKTPNDHPL